MGIPLKRNFTSVDIELLNAIIRPIFRRAAFTQLAIGRRSL